MTAPARRPASLIALAVVAAAAAVVWRYNQVETPGPLVVLALAAAWVLLLTLAGAGLGFPIVRWFGLDELERTDGWVVGLATGAVALIGAAWLLSLGHLLRPPALTAVLLAAAASGAVALRRTGLGARGLALGWPCALVAAAVGAVTLLTACTLSPFYDQWHQHLGFPYQWLRHGRLELFPRDLYSLMPNNPGLLYTYALGLLGPWAAQVTHWWLGGLAVAGVGAIAHRLGGRSAAVWAGTLFLTTPTVTMLATTAGTDLAIAALAAAAWILVLHLGDPETAPRPRLWLLAGALVGAALGCKVVALSSVALPVTLGAAVVLLGRRRHTGESLATAATALVCCAAGAVLAFAPWAGRNLAATGNPLYPFFPSLFSRLGAHFDQKAATFAHLLSGVELSWSHLLSGLDLGTFSRQVDGFAPVGPLYLTLLPTALLVLLRQRPGSGRLALAAGTAAGVLGWSFGMHVSRYLVPVLVPLAALLGDGLAQLLAGLERRVRWAVTTLVVVLVGWGLQTAITPLGLQRLTCSLDRASAEPILEHWVSCWPALRWINQALPADARLLMVAESRALLLDRDVILDDPYLTPLLVELAESAKSPAAMAEELRRAGVTYLLINRLEAERMRRMTGRRRYFETRSPEAAERLERFLATALVPVWERGGVGVYLLAGPAG